MANINIQDGIISSSADYSLYHGTTKVADVELDAIRVQGDINAENYIVSSSTTYMTTSFSDGSTKFGDTIGDTHQFTGSMDVSGSITGENFRFRVDNDTGISLFGAGNQVAMTLNNNANWVFAATEAYSSNGVR